VVQRLIQLSAQLTPVAQLVFHSRAAQLSVAHQWPSAAHSASFSPRLAARWDPAVITFAAPEPAARPHRAGPRAAPWLCVAPAPSSLGPHAVSAALGLFSRRRRSSLGFAPYPQQPRAAAASNPRLPPPASILLGRRPSFVVEQCRASREEAA
jgi:hypothetical protein